MKTLLISLTLSVALHAGESRTWTQADTKRTLEGEAVDKKRDGSAVQIETDAGRLLWLQTATLIQKDKTFIEHWLADEDKLEVRVVGSKSGGRKRIKVTVKSGNVSVRVVSKASPTDTSPVVKKVKAKESVEFEHDVTSNYVVTLYSGESEIDKETSSTKTGL